MTTSSCDKRECVASTISTVFPQRTCIKIMCFTFQFTEVKENVFEFDCLKSDTSDTTATDVRCNCILRSHSCSVAFNLCDDGNGVLFIQQSNHFFYAVDLSQIV